MVVLLHGLHRHDFPPRMLRLGELKVEMQVMKDDMKAEQFTIGVSPWGNISMMMMMMMMMMMVMMSEGISCAMGHVLGGPHTISDLCVLARF